MGRRMFLSESAPVMALGEVPPGPGWREAPPRGGTGQVAEHATTPVSTPARRARSTSEPRQLSLSDMVSALSTAMATIPAQEGPGDAFHRLAELRARAEGISLADAYRCQSESTPELWADVRNAAPRGY